MVERCEQTRLAIESREPLPVGGEGGRENLDCHLTGEPVVAGTVDFAHSAATEHVHDLVGAESVPGSSWSAAGAMSSTSGSAAASRLWTSRNRSGSEQCNRRNASRSIGARSSASASSDFARRHVSVFISRVLQGVVASGDDATRVRCRQIAFDGGDRQVMEAGDFGNGQTTVVAQLHDVGLTPIEGGELRQRLMDAQDAEEHFFARPCEIDARDRFGDRSPRFNARRRRAWSTRIRRISRAAMPKKWARLCQ